MKIAIVGSVMSYGSTDLQADWRLQTGMSAVTAGVWLLPFGDSMAKLNISSRKVYFLHIILYYK